MSLLERAKDAFTVLAIAYRDTDTGTRELASQLFMTAADIDTDVGLSTAYSLLQSCEYVEKTRTAFDIRFGFYAGIPSLIRDARDALEKYEANR